MALGAKILGFIAGGAVARALGITIEPALENVRQDAWKANPILPLDAQTLGALRAQELIDAGSAAEQAERAGVGADKLEYLYKLNETVPGIGETIELLRREFIDDSAFELALRKTGLRSEFRDGSKKLRDSILSPADIANAVQQGFLPNEGILPGVTGGETGIDIPVDEVGISPHTEAKHSGYDANRLKVLTELVGLPPGPIELLQMLNRGIITDRSYYVGIREGHTKTKWADALKALRHLIISPIQYANLHLRQWITAEEMYAGGSLSGADKAHMDLLYKMQGRPPGPGQLQTAFNRGLIDRARFTKGIAESDVRTEWEDVEFGLRVRYPTVFVLRQLVSSGALTQAEGERILLLEGFEPDLAKKISTAWSAGKTAKQKELTQGVIETLYEARYIDASQATDLLKKLGYNDTEITLLLELGDARRVKRFLDTAVGRIHTKYVSHILPRDLAVQELNALNISAQAVADLMAEWDLERDVNKPVLSPAQIAGAVYYGIIPRALALTMLQSRGYSADDALVVVDLRAHGIPPGTPPPVAP